MENKYNKHLTIDDELSWYEIKINQIKQYIEGINLAELTDRMDFKETAKGGVIRTVIASKEQQSKNFMDLMEKLPKLFNQLDELRNKYQEKQMSTRGNIETKNTGIDFIEKI